MRWHANEESTDSDNAECKLEGCYREGEQKDKSSQGEEWNPKRTKSEGRY